MFLIKISGMVFGFHQFLYVSAKHFNSFLKSTNSLLLQLYLPPHKPWMRKEGVRDLIFKKYRLNTEQLKTSISKNYQLLLIAEMEPNVCFLTF